jgi:hypothetical protein
VGALVVNYLFLLVAFGFHFYIACRTYWYFTHGFPYEVLAVFLSIYILLYLFLFFILKLFKSQRNLSSLQKKVHKCRSMRILFNHIFGHQNYNYQRQQKSTNGKSFSNMTITPCIDQTFSNPHYTERCVSTKYRSDTTLTRHLRRLVAAG